MRMALFPDRSVSSSMTTAYDSNPDPKLLVRGIRLDLDDAARVFIETKAARVFQHAPRILRLRIGVEREARSRTPRFIAKGRCEVAGPDLAASVTHAVASVSITLLIHKLDRMLRRRTNSSMRRSTGGDIPLTTRARFEPEMMAHVLIDRHQSAVGCIHEC